MITTKIFHIRVGEEKPFKKEDYGYVNNDTGYIFLQKRLTDLVDFSIRYGKLNGEWAYSMHYKMWIDKKGLKDMEWRCLEEKNDKHPLSRIAEKLGASIYGGFEDEKNFYIVLPTFIKTLVGTNLYTNFVVGDYGYKHGLGKGIFCFGEYRWENSDLDGYVENNEEDKPAFYGFYWLRSRGGDLDRLPSPQYNDFKVEGNIFKDYAETGKIKDDLTIFTI